MALFETADRTEPATPRKRQEAREHGQVARSQDMVAALVLLAGCLGLRFFGMPGLKKLGAQVSRSFLDLRSHQLDVAGVLHAAGAGMFLCLEIVLPLSALVFLVAMGANLLQVGFLVTGHPVAPDLGRLSPTRGLARILSARGLFRGGFGLLKVAVVGGILVFTLWSEVAGPRSPGAVMLLSGSIGQAVGYALDTAVGMALRALAALLLLAIFDYGFQRWLHERDLRMTKAELKEEMRRMEGDPKVRERRRRVQEQLRFQRMMRTVPGADVVVTNPTHVAVAIRYQRREMAAPRVVAKGEGYIAQRIREVALEHEVPVVERKELARALYQAVEVGQEVPPELYQAVAELLAYVYRMAGRAGGGPSWDAGPLQGGGTDSAVAGRAPREARR